MNENHLIFYATLLVGKYTSKSLLFLTAITSTNYMPLGIFNIKIKITLKDYS